MAKENDPAGVDPLAQDVDLLRMQMGVLGEVIQCDECVHQHDRGYSCSAYPDGIPGEIMVNTHDHHEHYPGDHGILFKEKKRATKT